MRYGWSESEQGSLTEARKEEVEVNLVNLYDYQTTGSDKIYSA